MLPHASAPPLEGQIRPANHMETGLRARTAQAIRVAVDLSGLLMVCNVLPVNDHAIGSGCWGHRSDYHLLYPKKPSICTLYNCLF